MIRVRSVLFGLVLAVSAGAHAQLPSGLTMPPLKYNAALLMLPPVQKELNLTPDAATKLQTAVASDIMGMASMLTGSKGGQPQSTSDPIKNRAKILASLESMQKKALPYLSATQRVRLHQVSLQAYGPTALADPGIAAEIGLSAKQQGILKSKFAQIAATVPSPFSGAKPGDPTNVQSIMAGSQKYFMAIRTRSEQILPSVLTPHQLGAWKTTLGRPFDFGLLGALGPMLGSL